MAEACDTVYIRYVIRAGAGRGMLMPAHAGGLCKLQLLFASGFCEGGRGGQRVADPWL